MTTEQIKAHYHAVMCKTIEEICIETIGRLPASGEKVGLLARERQAKKRSALCKALREFFEVSLDGGEQMGYDELCAVIWNELESRVPYWRWIVSHCRELGNLELDETEIMPWQGFMDALDLMDLALGIEDTYGVKLCNEIADEVKMRDATAKELLDFLTPVIDELGLLGE